MRLGTVLGRWGLPLFLAVISLVGWQVAEGADFDSIEGSPIAYEQTLDTPMLSARRIPRTMRAPVSDRLMSETIDRLTATVADRPVCIAVRNGSRSLGQAFEPAGGLVPASNQKLLTTWAALEKLGPEFRFTTRVAASTPPVDGVVEGDLFLIGGGDPFLYTDDWLGQYEDPELRYHTRLEDLADAVAATGITSITGAVVGDETLLDTERYGPWDARLIRQQQSGPLSALVVNEGFAAWPDVYQAARLRTPDPAPAVHAASQLNQLLQQRGITVAGAPGSGPAPGDAVEVATVSSPPLPQIISHINAYSSNMGAELLLKRLGLEVLGDPSTSGGAAAVTQTLSEAGIPMNDVLITDGSGLSESNRLTCDAVSSVLVLGAGPDSVYGQSLAIGGQTGSLRLRFVDAPAEGLVFAKTGTLQGVSALSGYVQSAVPDAEGEYVTFAQIFNDPAVIDTEFVASVQEPLVNALVAYPPGETIENLSPTDPIPVGTN